MKRIVKKPGDVFKFQVSDGRIAYAQWLEDNSVRVFKGAFKSEVTLEEISELPLAFRVAIFRDTPKKYNWIKIGNLEIPEEFKMPRNMYKRDKVTGQVSIVDFANDTITPATEQEIEGLELWAVWAGHNIVDRLEKEMGHK